MAGQSKYASRIKFFEAEVYTPMGAMANFSEQGLKREYQRLYKLTQDRMRRLKEAGIPTQGYHQFTSYTKTDANDVPFELSNMYNFLNDYHSNPVAARRALDRTLYTLRTKYGYEDADEDNYLEYLYDLMDNDKEFKYAYRQLIPVRLSQGNSIK